METLEACLNEEKGGGSEMCIGNLKRDQGR